MPELFLHIGSHKTGTTSIQRTFSRLSEQNETIGLNYLTLGRTGTKVIRTKGELQNFQASVALRAAERVFRPKGQGKFVASEEGFFWISEPESVHQLARLLYERFSRVTILCYLRRQDHVAVSHRKQVADGMPAARFYGLHASPLPKYQPHFHRYFDYATKLSNVWASAFGKSNVQLISYDEISRMQGDVVQDFAYRIGAPSNISNSTRSNTSYKGSKTFVGLKLMAMGLPAKQCRKIVRRTPGWGKYLPSQSQAREFLSHFSEANLRLAQEWTYEGRPFSFDDSFDMYPSSAFAVWAGRKGK